MTGTTSAQESMSTPVKTVLWALTLVLVLFPLSAARPGQPPTMKADEPGYFLAGLSLAFDGDLRCDQQDVQRAFDHYQYFPVNNLILMSPDGWQTVYFGKPYIYSFLAAPLAALAGPKGYVVFNMLLLTAMIWMGAVYLRRFNSDAMAALYSSLFFLLSAGFVYAFWIHPEVLNMFSIAACLFFALHERQSAGPADQNRGLRRAIQWLGSPALWPAWSGALLAPAVYNKPMLALLGVPALFWVTRKRGWKAAVTWLVAAAIAMGLIAGISIAFTGKPSAYLGVARGGVNIDRPADFANSIATVRNATAARTDANPNSWQWMFRIPKTHWGKLAGDLRYFLVGRHTGLLPYFPFAVLSVLLFLLHGRGSRSRWLLLASCALVALVFLLWIPFNWHGGGGFVGNRYYVNAYPAFLFLVTAIRPVVLMPLTGAFAALTVGSIVFAPWGLAVPQGSLQAHTRGGIYRGFPPELTMHNRISGYESFGVGDVGMVVREDLSKILSKKEGIFRIRGAVTSEIWAFGKEPLERLFLEVRSPLADNEVVIHHAGWRQVVRFEGADTSEAQQQIVEVPLESATRIWDLQGQDQYFYRLRVTPRHGVHEAGNMRNVILKPLFYTGARLRIVGTDPPEEDDTWRVDWKLCEVPATATTAGRITVPIRVVNSGTGLWRAGSTNQVRFTYRWLDEDGTEAKSPTFRRTQLRRDIEPGKVYSTTMALHAPYAAGTYRLVIAPTRIGIGRFPPQEGGSCEGTVVVERGEQE